MVLRTDCPLFFILLRVLIPLFVLRLIFLVSNATLDSPLVYIVFLLIGAFPRSLFGIAIFAKGWSSSELKLLSEPGSVTY